MSFRGAQLKLCLDEITVVAGLEFLPRFDLDAVPFGSSEVEAVGLFSLSRVH